MLRVALYKGFYECGLADTRRSDYGDNLRGWVEGKAIDLRNVEALFFYLERPSAGTIFLQIGLRESYLMGADCLLCQSPWFRVGKSFGVSVCRNFSALAMVSCLNWYVPPVCFFFSFVLR